MDQDGGEAARHGLTPRSGATPKDDLSTRLAPWATLFRPAGLPAEPKLKQWSAAHKTLNPKCREPRYATFWSPAHAVDKQPLTRRAIRSSHHQHPVVGAIELDRFVNLVDQFEAVFGDERQDRV